MLISRFYLYSTSDSYIGQCEWILVLLRKRLILYCRSEEDAVERTERKKREKSSQNVCKEDKKRKKLKIERECEDEGREEEEEEEEEEEVVVVTVGTSLSAAKSVKKGTSLSAAKSVKKGERVKNLSTASGSKWPTEKEKAQAATKRLKRRKRHKISTSAAEKLTSARLKSYGF